MSTLIIENLPEPLYTNIKERARRNRRSENNEAVALLEKALQEIPTISPPIKLRRGHRPSIDEIESIIAQGHK